MEDDDDGGGAFWLIPPLFGCMLECKYDGMTTRLLHVRKAFSWRFFNPGQMDRIGWAGMDWEIRVYICYLDEMKYE